MTKGGIAQAQQATAIRSAVLDLPIVNEKLMTMK